MKITFIIIILALISMALSFVSCSVVDTSDNSQTYWSGGISK